LQATPASARARIRAASPCLSVWTGEDDDIAILVLDPDLPVLRSWVDVRLQDDPGAQTSDPLDGGVEVVDLEPEQDTMAVGRTVGTDQVWVLLLVPGVQLEDEGLSTHEAVIEKTVGMVRIGPMHVHPEQGLIPSTAGLHVPHCNQCLRSDRRSIQPSH